MSEPSISITRFSSYDRVVADDLSLLDGLLRASATRYAGSRLGPIGPQLPFSKLCTDIGYMIPPTVGADFSPMNGGVPVRVDDQRTEPTVAIRGADHPGILD